MFLGGGGGGKTGWLEPGVRKTSDGVGKVAGQLEELMLAEAGVGKVAGRLEEQMLAEAGVGEVARLLVGEGMVLALLATIEMKTEDQ